MKFKSEEDRAKAYDTIPDIEDAPAGVDLEKWREEMEKKLTEIDDAEIDENYLDETPKSEKIEKKDEKLEKKDESKVSKTEDFELAQTRINDLQNERKEMMSKFDREKQELINQIKSFEEKAKTIEPKKEPEIEQDSKVKEKDKEITDIQHQISELEKAMNDIDDPFDEDLQRAMKKTTSLNSRLNRLLSEKYNIQLSKNASELAELKKQQKDAQTALQKKHEEDQKKKTESEGRRKTLESIENFRKKSEFISKKSFDEMENEYADFAVNCAIADTGKAPNEITAAESERAIQRYLKKTPLLVEKLKDKGLREPDDMREFLILSDINALKLGVKLNQSTGEWVELLNDEGKQIHFPDLDSAYEYYKKEKGITGQELLNREREAAKSVILAIQKRANPKELDEAHSKDKLEDMDKDVASKIISDWDETEIIQLARRDINSKKVQTYNKALMVMGLDPIEEGF